MATINNAYAAAASVTITMTSLGDGSWRQSAVVDNTSDLYLDALVGGSIQTGTSPSTGGRIDVYAYGTYDGTNYTAGASGSDAAYTANGEEGLLVPLISIIVNNTSDKDYVWGPISVAEAFGYTLPSKWGIVIENNTGATLNATGTNNEIQFIGVEKTSA